METKKTFIMQQVLDDLIDPDRSLEHALRRLQYFSRLIKNEPLYQFTTNELGGYDPKAELPPYRHALATIYVYLRAGYHEHVKELPASMLEEPLNKIVELGIREGIRTLEKIDAVASEDEDKALGRPVPMEMLQFIQPAVRKLYRTDTTIHVTGAKVLTN